MSPAQDEDTILPSHREERISILARSDTRTPVAKWVSYIVTPSILTKAPRQELASTSYLDGLRGFAALLVYIQHHQIIAHLSYPENSTDIFYNAFGYRNQYYFACLPFIRIFFSGGNFAVATFFVISGYALSAKPLALIHRKEFENLGDVLASAIFRRWMRLYLPVALTTLAYITTLHLFRIWMPFPPKMPTYGWDLLRWTWLFRNFSLVWAHYTGPGSEATFAYNIHLWSIPIEFRGSLVIYTTVMALSRCRRNLRPLIAIVIAWYFLYFVVDGHQGGAFYAMFVSGLLLCELDLLSAECALPSFLLSAGTFIRKEVFFGGLLVVSLYLGGVPSFDSNLLVLKESPGWSYLSILSSLVSSPAYDYKWYYLFFAATFLVISIPRLAPIRKLFESRFCQYLGRISFAFYLVHGPILWTLGDRLYLAAGWIREEHAEGLMGWMNLWPMSRKGPLGLEIAFLVPQLILLPTTLLMAEVVTRLCDGPSVRFSRWVYEQSCQPSGKL